MTSTTHYLTLEDVADILRVSRRHMAYIMARGDGPPVLRLGRRVVVRPEALAAWVIEREERAAA